MSLDQVDSEDQVTVEYLNRVQKDKKVFVVVALRWIRSCLCWPSIQWGPIEPDRIEGHGKWEWVVLWLRRVTRGKVGIMSIVQCQRHDLSQNRLIFRTWTSLWHACPTTQAFPPLTESQKSTRRRKLTIYRENKNIRNTWKSEWELGWQLARVDTCFSCKKKNTCKGWFCLY